MVETDDDQCQPHSTTVTTSVITVHKSCCTVTTFCSAFNHRTDFSFGSPHKT